MSRIITATFKGQDGSLGYKTHKEYTLSIVEFAKGGLRIHDMSQRSPAQDCEYSSMIAFLENWKNPVVCKEEKLKPRKDRAINFIDFCKGRTNQQIKKAMKFYNQPFDAEKVTDYFLNWSFLRNDKRYKNGIILTNSNTKGWKVKVWINDGAEYTFCSGSGGTDNPQDSQWQYLPETMWEFISDCLRYEDIELLFSKKAMEEIYG
jgi:hypothetical protein